MQVTGKVQSLYPCDGGQIDVESFHFTQGLRNQTGKNVHAQIHICFMLDLVIYTVTFVILDLLQLYYMIGFHL